MAVRVPFVGMGSEVGSIGAAEVLLANDYRAALVLIAVVAWSRHLSDRPEL
jgi:hypothetical protein